ncbi:hypothetical protein DQQ10_17215 [Pseudochryseolinea flava]|uniref:Transporter n=2 Tax=Pseudochryseolinea flava TaxID=2059302 RepID=A0A364XZG8_9BACT|nr:hypothetical protein DQQ10_17215 [Pseudochryseolinea flava]
MRLTLITGIVLLSFSGAVAQNFVSDALLFSRSASTTGSARMQALGGAHSSIGGDYSAALSNPAGLGMYNRSEATLTLGFNNYNTSANYLRTKSETSGSKLNLPGLSVVLNYKRDEPTSSGFLGWNFGITLTRTNDINRQYSYNGLNDESTILYSFEDLAAEFAGEDFESMIQGNNNYYNLYALAYNNYLIDTVQENGSYAGYYQSPWDLYSGESRSIEQRESIKRRGAQYQWTFAAGVNFSDRLFMGAGVGITTLRYKLSQTYTERLVDFDANDDYYPDLREFTIGEDLDIQGTGVNLTLGLIYRPIDFVQLGASFVTPTIHQITDNYTAGITSEWNTQTDTGEKFPEALLSEYNFNTPSRLSGGITFISKYGFLTGTVERVNYRRARYSSDIAGIDYDLENEDISKAYRSTTNFRFGAEFRYEQFRIRGGYGIMGDPYVDTDNIDRKITTLSGGVGIRQKKFFTDFTVITTKTEGLRIPYTAFDVDTPVANLKFTNTNFVVTVGFTF